MRASPCAFLNQAAIKAPAPTKCPIDIAILVASNSLNDEIQGKIAIDLKSCSMPLQESFGKKSKQVEKINSANRTRVLTSLPSLEDICFTRDTAQKTARQPFVITWKKEGGGSCLLTVTGNSEGSYDPTWMLHVDEGLNRVNIVWTYTTSDAELIYSLLTEAVNTRGPAAVIPESLRPHAVEHTQHLLGLTVAGADDPLFFEHYEILETIGRGGMGIIYRARHRNDGSMVALKVLRTDLLVDPVSVRRFEQEATAASSLRHPNLIRVREFGLSRFGQPYLIMDYLDGVELQTLLSHCDHLDLPTFINIFTQMCDALAYAHDKGLVHRDLKPGNIMLVQGPTGTDTVKIIDFGIAKMLREHNPNVNITTGGDMLGSPAYMSPEQCGGVSLDSRSDIYSLGCVMYEAITGMIPFRTESAIGTIMMQVNEHPVPLAIARADLRIPDELERIIFKSMEKDPALRYQTASELGEELWTFAAQGYQSPPKKEDLEPTPIVNPQSAEYRIIEQNAMSDKCYTLLRRSGVLSDSLLHVASECETLVNAGKIDAMQAVKLIQATQRGVALKDALATLLDPKPPDSK